MASAFFNTLYNASFRGAPFVVTEAANSYGRKNAIHTYPQRDGAVPEDLGRRPREFMVEGFIEGDDVVAQRDWIVALVEMSGPGILIHPTRGIVNVAVIDFTETSRLEGRVIYLRFHFMEANAQTFPSVLGNTFGAIGDAVGNLFGASTASFISSAGQAITTGLSVVQKGAALVGTISAVGGAAVKGTTNLLGSTSALVGNYGRFSGGSTGSSTGSVSGVSNSVGSTSTQISNLIAQGASASSGVSSAGSSMFNSMSQL